MNYFLPAALRDALLEYMEEWETVRTFPDGVKFGNKEALLAAQLRDLKPLREIKEPA